MLLIISFINNIKSNIHYVIFTKKYSDKNPISFLNIGKAIFYIKTLVFDRLLLIQS